MGIKDLWPILLPFSERKPLYELEGKIVAVDLAGWVCESLNVVDFVVQPRMYLRNLFFRVAHLLLCGVTPVFVLEGDAPSLKYNVIRKRNEIQFKGAKPRDEQNNIIRKADKGRTRFNHVLKQCEELLITLGVQCVQATGEAEAFCAYLNSDGIVDGVISQDSDCFGYGATKVYRNFSISHQGNNAAQGGAVDVYDLKVVQKTMDMGQNKMIVLALLSGCDYCPDGIDGIGKDYVLKLFNRYKNDSILDHIKSWRNNDNYYTELEMKVDNKSICVDCGHHGRVQNHSKNGCSVCRTHNGCDSSLWKEERLSLKAELQIRKKALLNLDFPSQEIIDEFLVRPEIPSLNLKWKQPNLVKFLKTISKLLQWDEIYCFQKCLPLLTRWQLLNYNSNNFNGSLKGILYPDYIKKKRTIKGIASYEIIWKDEIKCFDGLIPEHQIINYLEQNPNGIDSLYSTIESNILVEKMYPKIIEDFNEKINAKKPKKKVKRTATKTPTKIKRKKIHSSLNDMSGLLEEIQNIEKKNTKKPNKKISQRRISRFLLKGKENENIIKSSKNLNENSVNISTFTDSNFSLTEMDSLNISEQILQIINKSPQKISYFRGRKLHYDVVETKFPTDKTNKIINNTLNDSIDMDNFNNSFNNLSTNNELNSTPILIKRFFERNNILTETQNETLIMNKKVKSDLFSDTFLENVLGSDTSLNLQNDVSCSNNNDQMKLNDS